MSDTIYPVSDFTGDAGEAASGYKSVTSARGLQPNEQVSISGNTNLSTTIRGKDDSCVYGITLTGSPGYYDYVLNVDAQGPEGWFTGSLYLAFRDESGDTYFLFIYSSKRSTHTLRYDSKQPAIKQIFWSDHDLHGQI
jgi:hypothetical protein